MIHVRYAWTKWTVTKITATKDIRLKKQGEGRYANYVRREAEGHYANYVRTEAEGTMQYAIQCGKVDE